MGSLFCPHASRVLLRPASARALVSRGLQTQAALSMQSTPLRWLSSKPWHSRSIQTASQARWRPGRIRSAAYVCSDRHGDYRSLFSSSTIIRDYQELPKGYRDQEGLQFRSKDLQPWEAKGIFGPDMSAEDANLLLRILHGRRVAGTLQDPAFKVHTAQFSARQINTGLAYLRKIVPVDETINAGLRAEDELDVLEQAEKQRQQKEAAKTNDAQSEEPTEVYKPDPIYGRSAFDEMRARNIAKRKAKEKFLQEEMRNAEQAGSLAEVNNERPLPTLSQDPALPMNPKIREYYEKAQSGLEAPPEMSAWQRILPSAVAVALVLGVMGAVCMVYKEPVPRYRLFQSISASQATVGAIIAINSLVMIGWRVPQLWALFNRYMILVVGTIKPVTLFTSAFSHSAPSHFVTNMVPLWFVGTRLHDDVGRARFLALYVGCGSVGFLGTLVVYSLRAAGLGVSSMGASGATLGIVSAYLWEHRLDGFRMFGLPHDGVRGIVFLAMVVATQLGALMTRARQRVDLVAHITGMLAGVAGMELMSRMSGKGARGRQITATRPFGLMERKSPSERADR